MHKNIDGRLAHDFSEELSDEYNKQLGGITQMIIDAVAQYNEMVPLQQHLKRTNVDERLIKEAEEESAKIFLDRLFDLVEKENAKSDFFR